MEGYKCPKCYNFGLTTSFLSSHFCQFKPIKPIHITPKVSWKLTHEFEHPTNTLVPSEFHLLANGQNISYGNLFKTLVPPKKTLDLKLFNER